jgi:DNA-binding LacI/PurR family transcriptional regulator
MSTLKRPTIDDVATYAGVSRAAVSKVLRDAYGTSAEMRRRVHIAIEALGYRPQLAARGLRGRTFTVGVVLPDLRDVEAVDTFEGILDRLSVSRYRVASVVGVGTGPSDEQLVAQLTDLKPDAAVLVGCRIPRNELVDFARDVPLVAVNCRETGCGLDTVNADSRQAARLAVDYLSDLGHRRIGYVAWRQSGTADDKTLAEHESGYRQEMLARGIGAHCMVRRHGPGEPVRTLFEPDAATAVIASDVKLCLDMMPEFEAHDLTIPEDLSVVGYGNSSMGAHPRVQLTTVEVPGRTVGATAADLLLERLAGRVHERHELVPPRLVVRATTAATPQRKIAPRTPRCSP